MHMRLKFWMLAGFVIFAITLMAFQIATAQVGGEPDPQPVTFMDDGSYIVEQDCMLANHSNYGFGSPPANSTATLGYRALSNFTADGVEWVKFYARVEIRNAETGKVYTRLGADMCVPAGRNVSESIETALGDWYDSNKARTDANQKELRPEHGVITRGSE